MYCKLFTKKNNNKYFMETHQDVALLKESFLEFITKVSPVLNEAILEQFNTKWLPFKKLLCDP
jgi:hypothetical protein